MTPAPYEQLYSYVASPFIFQTETLKMAERAKEVRFSGFKDMLRKYIDAQSAAKRRNLVPNQTEFDGQEIELNCGTWDSLDYGIFRDTPNGGRECACAHPIMPVERLVNIDTGEVKLKLAYKRSGKAKSGIPPSLINLRYLRHELSPAWQARGFPSQARARPYWWTTLTTWKT